MKIVLKKLSMLNFKGARNTEIEFGTFTDIYGRNATGKTTIIDAWLWLLFGKDHTDRTSFEIKTLDKENKPFHKMDHSVTAVIVADGDEITISRIYREKWTKKKGKSDTEFEGHEQIFYWNDVPLKESEFISKINGLVQENIFKLLTNTGFFNSNTSKWTWKDRRNTLLAIAGDIPHSEVIKSITNKKNEQQMKSLLAILNSKKSLEEYKREIAGKKKKIRDELELIPSRIDEASRSLPDDVDYTDIENQLETEKQSLINIDELLMNKTKAQRERQDQATRYQTEIHQLQTRNNELQFQIQNKVKEGKLLRERDITVAKTELRQVNDDILTLRGTLTRIETEIKTYEAEKNGLREEWQLLNKETYKQPEPFKEPPPLVFDESDFCCPACKRAYETTDIESKKAELQRNYEANANRMRKLYEDQVAQESATFNQRKNKRLTEITNRGKALSTETAVLDGKRVGVQGSIESKSQEVNALQIKIRQLEDTNDRLSSNEQIQVKNAIADNKEISTNIDRIERLEKEIFSLRGIENNSELLNRKKETQNNIYSLQEQLSGKSQKEVVKARIEELTRLEKEMSVQLADLEGTEFSIQEFVRAQMDTLESRINGMFKTVKFKLFNYQVNGGVDETCETLIDGVPYSDANNAARINAGIDIINTLSEFYDTYAPVFVDNAESVNTLIPVQSQLIRLVVSEDKKLKIKQVGQVAEAA
jgi:exonuclease SbcC